jgi:UDP-N-acetylmuramate dehydrogenase
MGNAGAFGGSLSDVVDRVTVFRLDTGELSELEGADLGLGYRRSGLRKNLDLVVSVRLRLTQSTVDAVSHKMFLHKQARKLTQPSGKSLGSVFKNPPTQKAAGRLIEEAGLKGEKRGGMRISEKHGNFIVNEGGGTPEEYLWLVELCERTVAEKYGIRLQREVRIIGERS